MASGWELGSQLANITDRNGEICWMWRVVGRGGACRRYEKPRQRSLVSGSAKAHINVSFDYSAESDSDSVEDEVSSLSVSVSLVSPSSEDSSSFFVRTTFEA